MSSNRGKLAPEVNRYNVTPEELFDLFGKFGPIRQVRQGIANNTKGTAFVVYEDVMDAKQACDKLNGFNFQNRYLVGPSSMSSPKTSTAAAAASPSSKTAHRHDKLGVAGHVRRAVVRFADGGRSNALQPQTCA
ncbi:pre-mRNA branch site protein p14 [Verticillium alfalfae VaMs.102]|uniref:Pre-mRNA branch site protein p14 n=1 Tax=Verticillium alfalfae (strain VaMs.102 / ATCC MYA-4576 / FGSC 10136) TaxID=526221 RepID=C9SLY1_VERA1|nr:pre-mRNA branch site protein p14 [Verticillium alfalfae VaMs.102]EEY19796.1 pre-mRNA branch site protein p14 [Verticillium alfalfae VaMs.102]